MELIAREQLYVRTTNKKIISDLKGLLDKVNPEYQKKKKMGYPVFDIDPRIVMYRIAKDKAGNEVLVIPRGTGKIVRDLCKKHGEIFKLTDQRTYLNESIDVFLQEGVTAVWYQAEAVKKMNEFQQGMIEAPCGSGKTVMGCLFIAEKKKKTLVLVHTLDLLMQWQDRIKEFLVGKYTIGQFGNGKKKHGDITIAMIQTISKLSKQEWREFEENYSIFIGDESHHFGAATYINVMQNIKAKYLIGLSATPKRKDGKTFVIHNYLGKVIYTITDDDLATAGRSVTCKVNIVKTGRKYNYSKMGEQPQVLSSEIAKDMERSKLIVEKVCRDLDDGRVPMILTERKFHAKYLISLLKEKGLNFGSITGEVPTELREKIKKQVRDGVLDGLLANKQIAAEGLDIPNIDSVHVAFFTSNESLLKQIFGRGRRVTDGKDHCRIWMYRDYIYKIVLGNNFNEIPEEAASQRYGWNAITKFCNTNDFDINNVDKNSEIIL